MSPIKTVSICIIQGSLRCTAYWHSGRCAFDRQRADAGTTELRVVSTVVARRSSAETRRRHLGRGSSPASWWSTVLLLYRCSVVCHHSVPDDVCQPFNADPRARVWTSARYKFTRHRRRRLVNSCLGCSIPALSADYLTVSKRTLYMFRIRSHRRTCSGYKFLRVLSEFEGIRCFVSSPRMNKRVRFCIELYTYAFDFIPVAYTHSVLTESVHLDHHTLLDGRCHHTFVYYRCTIKSKPPNFNILITSSNITDYQTSFTVTLSSVFPIHRLLTISYF